MTVEIADAIQALIKLTTPDDASAPTVVSQNGFVDATAARSAAGVYTVELDEEEIDADNLIAIATAGGPAGGPVNCNVGVQLLSGPSRVEFRTYNTAGAAADLGVDLNLVLLRTPLTGA